METIVKDKKAAELLGAFDLLNDMNKALVLQTCHTLVMVSQLEGGTNGSGNEQKPEEKAG